MKLESAALGQELCWTGMVVAVMANWIFAVNVMERQYLWMCWAVAVIRRWILLAYAVIVVMWMNAVFVMGLVRVA